MDAIDIKHIQYWICVARCMRFWNNITLLEPPACCLWLPDEVSQRFSKEPKGVKSIVPGNILAYLCGFQSENA